MDDRQRSRLRVVCDKLLNGENILDICSQQNTMSYAELMTLIKKDDDAALMMDETREMVRSRWVATLENIGTKEYKTTVQAATAKMHSDNLRWLLEKEWSDKYGSRIGIDVNVDVNLRVALDKSLSRLGTLVQTPLLNSDAMLMSGSVIDVNAEPSMVEGSSEVDPMS